MSLRDLRKQRSWSQEDLALEANVNPGTIKTLEAGTSRPRPETVGKLAAALGIEPTELERHLADAGGALDAAAECSQKGAILRDVLENSVGDRRDRLRAIRARLAELLASGELERLSAEREAYKPRPEVTVTNLARHVATTLGDARALEDAGPEWRGTESWKQRAEYVAEKLEGLAAWLDEDDRA